MRMKLVSEIMTKRVFYLTPTANLRQAFQSMLKHDFRHLPVLSYGKLVGIISDRDIKCLQSGKKSNPMVPNYFSVEEVMSKNVISIGPTTSVSEAARILIDNKFNCIPVIADSGELLGIVTSTDLLMGISQQVSESNQSNFIRQSS